MKHILNKYLGFAKPYKGYFALGLNIVCQISFYALFGTLSMVSLISDAWMLLFGKDKVTTHQ